MTEHSSKLGRRTFLKRAALTGGAAAVAAAALPKGAKAAEVSVGPKGKGYQETQHVRTYYDLAKF